ncbi:MAG: nuclear transport factor 2 family protein [Rhodospirillaceae bacterium]|nr:nuclear transport factor 2 family protein [Rhodospirillaceae bacterium]
MLGGNAPQDFTRRTACAGSGLLLLSALAGPAAAAEATGLEKANGAMLADFFARWGAPEVDIPGLLSFLTEDCELRLAEDRPPLIGKAAVAQALEGFFANATRYKTTITDSFAKGGVVAHARDQSIFRDGKQTASLTRVSMFLIKDGKIKYWSNHPV